MRNKHPKDKQRLFEKVTNLFISLFIDDILDIKNLEKIEDLLDKEKICKKRRKVREHQDYLKIFVETSTYNFMLKYIVPHPESELNADGVNVLEFLKERKRRGASADRRERTFEVITPRDPELLEHQKLSELYDEANLLSPIELCDREKGN